MMPSFEDLVRDIESSVTSEENKTIARAIAAHAIRITAKAATDPAAAEREATHLQAAVSNLAAAEAATVQAKILDFVGKVLTASMGLA